VRAGWKVHIHLSVVVDLVSGVVVQPLSKAGELNGSRERWGAVAAAGVERGLPLAERHLRVETPHQAAWNT
jgi:hypothetical protein